MSEAWKIVTINCIVRVEVYFSAILKNLTYRRFLIFLRTSGWYEDNWFEQNLEKESIDCTVEQMRIAAEGHLTTEALMWNQNKEEMTISKMVRILLPTSKSRVAGARLLLAAKLVTDSACSLRCRHPRTSGCVSTRRSARSTTSSTSATLRATRRPLWPTTPCGPLLWVRLK